MSSSAVAAEVDVPRRSRTSVRPDRELAGLYRDHHRFIWRSLVRLGVPDAQVDDALHDTFLVVARRFGEFEGRANVRTWLFAVAMRVAQSARRDHAREQRRRAKIAEVRALDHEPHERADAARTLRDLLGKLDDDKRAVFIMAELEGMTAQEIAGVVQVKVATVYSRLRLAREHLSRTLDRDRHRDRSRRGRR